MTQVTRASPMLCLVLQVIFSSNIILSATAQSAVTYPRVAVGTFSLKFAEDDPSWTSGAMVLDTPSPTSGSSSTLSTWSGVNAGSAYSDGGFSLVAQSCAVSGGSVSVIMRVTKSGDFRQCNYMTYSKDASGKTVLNALTALSNDFTYPTGDCPATPQEAESGITWLPSLSYANTTWSCDANCQPLDCNEYGTTTATTSPASLQTVTYPRVAVGTFSLKFAEDDPSWTSGAMVLDAPSPTSGSSSTLSTWSGVNAGSAYSDGGFSLVAQSCAVSGGSVSVIMRVTKSGDFRQCNYMTYSKDASGKTVLNALTALSNDFTYPTGDCPATPQEAESGITWLPSLSYANTTWSCDANCQPLDCNEYGTTTATTSPASLQTVTFPRVAVGKFTLVSSSDPLWTEGTYVQDVPSPTSSSISTVSTDTGVHDGDSYSDGGYDTVAQSCVVSDGGSVSVIRKMEYYEGSEGWRYCYYQTYSKDTSGSTISIASTVSTDSDEDMPFQYPMGDCPSTFEAAKQNGIYWMNPVQEYSSSTWRCVENCQPLDCNEYGTTTATTSPASLQTVTYPRVAVGTFSLKFAEDDPSWTSGAMVLDTPSPTSGSSSTLSTWSGVNAGSAYSDGGFSLVAQSCAVSGGSVSVIMRVTKSGDFRQCNYMTYSKDASGKTVLNALTALSNDFTYPTGDCPATPQEAESGITWLPSLSYANTTWSCDANCQPLDCNEYGTTTATTSPASLQTVTFPRVAVGKFTLVSSSDPLWTEGTYVQDVPSPTSSSISTVSTDTGVHDGDSYSDGGYDTVAQSCVVSDGGSVSVIRKMEYYEGSEGWRYCYYQTYSKDTSGSTISIASTVSTDSDEDMPFQYPMGDCPSTFEAAKQNGIYWMNPVQEYSSSTWRCVENCQPLDCNEYGTTTATTSPASLQTVTYPRVAVGTFSLKFAEDDPSWTSGAMVLDAPSPTSGSSSTLSTWSGVNAGSAYSDGGFSLVAQSCAVSGGSVSVIMRVTKSGDFRQCNYMTYSKDASGKTVLNALTALSNDFTYPTGDCPATPQEAESGITWLPSLSYANTTWSCDANCQPLDCNEYGTTTATTSPASLQTVTFPRVAVGKFTLVSSSDTLWTEGTYVQDVPSPTSSSISTVSTDTGVHDGDSYSDGGYDTVAQSCVVSDGGSVSVIRKMEYYEGSEGWRYCYYQTYSKDTSGSTISIASTVSTDSDEDMPFQYPMGDCPSTFEAAKQNGIYWMNPVQEYSSSTWRCVENCQPLDCNEYGTTTATTSPASLQTVTYPRVAVGTFSLKFAEDDPSWTSGAMVLDAPSPTSGSSSTLSTWSGVNAGSAYSDGGFSLVAQSCAVSGGSVSVIMRVTKSGDFRQCNYMTYSKDASGKTVLNALTALSNDFTYPTGDCPATPQEAESGITWLPSLSYANTTWSCDANCQPLDCNEYGTTTATTSPASLQTVTFPRVAVGKFTLVSSSDTLWTEGTYVQDVPSPTSSSISTVSTDTGVHDGDSYSDGGYDTVAQSCVVSDGGSVSVIRKMEYYEGSEGWRYCYYQTYSKDTSGSTISIASTVSTDSDEDMPFQYPMGDCPSTFEAAKQNGIYWMNPVQEYSSSTWRCVENCQPLDCNEYGTTTATTSPASLQTVTYPRVAVGTFSLKFAEDDPSWTSGAMVLDAPSPTSGSSSTLSTWSGVNAGSAYSDGGFSLVAQSCAVSGGSVSVIMRVTKSGDFRQCNYMTYRKDASGKTVLNALTALSNDFTYPTGDCPATPQEAESGITWLPSLSYANTTWSCDANCQPLDCNEYGTAPSPPPPPPLPPPPPPPPPPPEFRPWVVRFSIQLVGYTVSELESLPDTYLTNGISAALYLSIHNATIDVISMEGASGATLRRSLLQQQPKVVVNFSISVASEEQARAINALLLSLSMSDLMQVLMMNGLAKLEPSPSLTSEPIVFDNSSNLPIILVYEGLVCGSSPCPSSQVILNVANDTVKVRIRFSDSACTGLKNELKGSIAMQGPAFIEDVEPRSGSSSYDVHIRANTEEVGNVKMTVASGVCTLGKRSSKKSIVLQGGTLQVDTERPTAQVGVLTPISNKENSSLTMRLVIPSDSKLQKGSLQASSFYVVNGNVSAVDEENKSAVEGERAFLISVIPTITEGIVNVSLRENIFNDTAGNGNKGVVRVIGGAANNKAQEVSMVPFLHDAVQPEASVSIYGDGYSTEEGLALFKLSFSEPVIGFDASSINVTNGILSSFVTLEGIEDPTQNTSSTVMDDLPYILATEIGLLVTPSSLKGDTNVTVGVIEGGFQDLSGNSGRALVRSASVEYRGTPEEEEVAEGVGAAATGTASVAVATGAVTTASLSVASTVAAATVSSVAVTGVSASVAAAEGSALCNAASSMSVNNMVGMLRALRTMQFYSMTKDFGGDSVPEAYRSFAGQLDWVTLQFGSSWFVSSDDGNPKKKNAQAEARRERRRRALLMTSSPTRRQSRGDGNNKSPANTRDAKASKTLSKVKQMKKDVTSVISVSVNASTISNMSSWLNSGDAVAAKSYWNGVVNPPTNDIEAFGQSALIGIALLAGASLIRFASERVYHVFSSSSDETPSTLVFPYVELTALNLIAPGVALSAGKLVGAKSAGIAEICVGVAAFLAFPFFLTMCALRVISGMVMKKNYAKYELEGNDGASMMLTWKSLGKSKSTLNALMRTRRKLARRRAENGDGGEGAAAADVTWAEAAEELSKRRASSFKSVVANAKTIADKTLKFSKSMNKYIEKKGEWVVNDDSEAIPAFVDVYGMFFSDYRGELPGEREFDPSNAEHFPGYPNGGFLASIRRLQLRATGGYLRGYHYRIGYGAFVAFKTFVFPFIFGAIGQNTMTNVYLTLGLTFVEFIWIIVWRPADDFLKHGVAQLDSISQVLATGAAVAASDLKNTDSTILWVMLAAASFGIFSVMLANLDSLRDGKDILVSIWDWIRRGGVSQVEDDDGDDVGDDGGDAMRSSRGRSKKNQVEIEPPPELNASDIPPSMLPTPPSHSSPGLERGPRSKLPPITGASPLPSPSGLPAPPSSWGQPDSSSPYGLPPPPPPSGQLDSSSPYGLLPPPPSGQLDSSSPYGLPPPPASHMPPPSSGGMQ